MSTLDVQRLADAMAYPDPRTDADDWDVLFDWHRDEDDPVKRLAAAEVIARRYGRTHAIGCALPDDHAGECWAESGTDDD